MYSYKSPRHKPLFSKDSLLWMIFVGVVSAALLSFGLYLFIASLQEKEKLKKVESSNAVLSKSVSEYEKEMKILKMKQALDYEVKTSNKLLKNSIKNLFDLVPDQIVLTKVVMQKDLLDIEGMTPTKDAYKLLLEPPLKSIFNESKVNFVLNPSAGKYEFKSINTITAKEQESNSGKK